MIKYNKYHKNKAQKGGQRRTKSNTYPIVTVLCITRIHSVAVVGTDQDHGCSTCGCFSKQTWPVLWSVILKTIVISIRKNSL